MAQVGGAATSAAFVARADHDALSAVVRAAIDVDDLLDVQRKVVQGAMLPKY